MFFCPILYVGNVTVIALNVLNNLLAQKWSRVLSESAVYAEIMLFLKTF